MRVVENNQVRGVHPGSGVEVSPVVHDADRCGFIVCTQLGGRVVTTREVSNVQPGKERRLRDGLLR